jgi:primosomal protein N' (replication factor Y)
MKNIFITNLNYNTNNEKYLSPLLIEKINETLNKNKKVILYLNRRWEYSSVICQDCNNIYKCKNCDLALKVHSNNKLVCHFCDYSERLWHKCKYCSSQNLKKIWVWTWQIETQINSLYWQKYNIFRFDRDNLKNKSEKKIAYQKLEKADIIIWTKMITTWFDFENIALVWVLLIENELLIPEYNTSEKLYQNIKQLIGRAWRKWQEAEIVIQSFIPENENIKLITDNNFKDFFLETLKERKLFNYPPFINVAEINYKNKDKHKWEEFIKKLYKNLLEINKNYKNKFEINLITQSFKRNMYHIHKIVIKWDNPHLILDNIKNDIFRNKDLSVNFV